MSERAPVDPAAERKDLLKRAFVRMEQLEAELRAERERAGEPLAIVGMGCRFPGGADDPDRFRDLLMAGFDATCEIPADRWDVDAYYDPDPDTVGTMYVRRGAFLTSPVDQFDPAFFGIAPREADELDPQQRLLLEVVWEALERAGHAPATLRNSPTGVFLGMCAHDWGRMQGGAGDTSGIGTYYGTGTAHSVAAGRLAYLLGLRGPAITVDTACSSSLVAFHLACQSLRAGEVREAIAAGVSLILAPDGHVIASRGRMLSKHGRCATFDASADGYVRGEGCAVVLLKRLSDARADGDRILAIVHGTASNQDGRSSGLTAPSGTAQEDVMRAALAASRLEASQIGYVETHGTGTELGDPIEVHAIAAVHHDRPKDRPLLIGSVKTNIGHLEGAAGLAGVIKSVIALREGVIPPHLHFHTPNPHIAWDAAPIAVPTTATPWPAGRRIAGVSSFGFSGTNVHVILESASEETVPAAERPSPVHGEVVPLSARTPGALLALAERVAVRLAEDETLDVRDVARTLARGRAHWEHRAAVIARDRSDLVQHLRAVGAPGQSTASPAAGRAVGEANLKRAPRVAFLFTGQGSQRPGMGRELLESEPVFRAAVDRCDAVLAPRLGLSVAALMRADPSDEQAAAVLQQTRITQPALFALEYALAELWRAWGVEPTVVLGHSVGEYVAACVAGVLSLEDALRLVAERGRLMGELPAGGAMAAVFADDATVRPLLGPFYGRVSIAAINGPASTVVSGDEDAVEALLASARERGIEGRRLIVSHAFHSHRMDSMLPAFRAVASTVRCEAPRIDVISNVTGERMEAGSYSADYWTRHVREPVLFSRSIDSVRAEGVTVLLELGPAPVLVGIAAGCPGAPEAELRIPTLRPGSDAHRGVREALAQLYVAGVGIDWNRVYPGPLAPVELPTYPFERQRHWFAPRTRTTHDLDAGHPLLGRRIESPRFSGAVFEVRLEEQAPAWIAHHRVFDRPVLPATAYVEMCRAAVADVFGGGHVLTSFRILEPLVLDRPHIVQTIVDLDERTVDVVSRESSGAWRTHVTSRVDTAVVAGETLAVPVDAGVDVDPVALLERIGVAGVEYGASFRGLRSIRRHDRVAVAEIDAAILPQRERGRYAMHPALLDAALQVCGALLENGGDVYMPVEIDAVLSSTSNGSAAAPDAIRVVARLREGQPGAPVLVCDLEVASAAGALRVEGLRFHKATGLTRTAESRAADWLYQLTWADIEPPTVPASGGLWRVLGAGADADAIATALRAHGRVADTEPLDGFGAGAHGGEALEGIVLVTGRTPLPDAGDALAEALRGQTGALLAVARAAAGGASVGRLCVITRGAWAVDPDEETDPAASALWGLGQTIAAEMPATGCRRIDVAATADLSAAADAVASALLMAGDEDRLALRGDRWRAARLVRMPERPRARRPMPDYRLEQRGQGDLERLELAPHEVEAPGPGQVAIRVAATGLNFRDVLNALGMYPGDAGPLGSECVGTVEAVGENVSDLRPGDVVMSITPRGFCSRVVAAAALTVRCPAGMTPGEAATIPIAFLTAHWALSELAGLRAGERVLVHAAAGGVGMAAVQLAHAAGAEVFATAGSRRKRDTLRRLGVKHVYDSRSLAFRDEILRDTGGEGVHVVLNSLADEFIPASLDVLAADGRFLEIGKTGVWDAARVAQVRPRASYHVIYLGEACEAEPARVRQRLLELVDMFDSRRLQPLPVRAFLVDDAVAAFRYMAQARHIGKIVLFDSLEAMEQPDFGAAWVTGGLGGVGLAIARQLVDRGVRRVALTGRGAPTADAERELEAMRAQGAEVLVLRGDVSHLAEVERVRDEIKARGWELHHVMHAAGVLDDAAIGRQEWPRFEKVLAPKAAGAWNLHLATRDLPLRSFVLFSAGAGVLGSPGQANYAAANAFLDGLALLRRSMGLPASSIAWGPWADVGMAARAGLDWSSRGLLAIDAEAGAAALRRIVREEAANAIVLPIDWTRFPVQAPDGGVRPFFSLVKPSAGDRAKAAKGAQPSGWRAALEGTPAADRVAKMQQLVAEEIMHVLGLDATRPPAPKQGLTDLGMDSLMAVELSNRIGRALAAKLPSTFAFEHPTVESMAAHLLASMEQTDTGRPTPAAPKPIVEAEIAAMTEDEASSALLDELEQIGY